jgi:hypothetical protein
MVVSDLIMEKEINILIDNIINQTRCFLVNAGEFYPFAAVIKPDRSIAPLGAYLENDQPESTEVLQILEESIKLRFIKKEAVVAGIGLDVLYKPAGESEKIDALKIMILTEEGYSKDYYLPYKNINGEFVFHRLFSETGTLRISSC